VNRAVAVVPAVLAGCLAVATLAHHDPRHPSAAPSPTPLHNDPAASVTAVRFVTALTTVDWRHPTPRPNTFDQVTTTGFAARLDDTAPALTAAQITGHASERPAAISVALRNDGGRTVALVTARVTVAQPGRRDIDVAVAWTLTLVRDAGGWRVAGATA
jgi:hypothetical protein